jgi:ketosteroid isomerase-like protein
MVKASDCANDAATPDHWLRSPAAAIPPVALPVAPASAQTPEPPPPPSVPLPEELARVLTNYEVAWRSKDAPALAMLFAEDGFVLSSGSLPVRGRAEIQKRYTGKGGPLALRALAYATEGSVGYVIGAFARQKGEPDVGKFTLTLRRTAEGRWLIVSDMDNDNARR